jgi:hypothetical protein
MELRVRSVQLFFGGGDGISSVPHWGIFGDGASQLRCRAAGLRALDRKFLIAGIIRTSLHIHSHALKAHKLYHMQNLEKPTVEDNNYNMNKKVKKAKTKVPDPSCYPLYFTIYPS